MNQKFYIVESLEEYRGYPYLILGMSLGHRCGYVGVNKDSKFYGKQYEDIDDFDIPGGLTFADTMEHLSKEENIPENLWWLGFDCHHYMDTMDISLLEKFDISEEEKEAIKWANQYSGGQVKDTEYVRRKCIYLITQIIEKESPE